MADISNKAKPLMQPNQVIEEGSGGGVDVL